MPIELQTRIDKAAKEIAQNYQRALKEVGILKTKINDLELVNSNTYVKTTGVMDQLNSAMDMLIKQTDAMIAESERAWEDYRKLEHDCKIGTHELSELNYLRDLCKKSDEFASDLLCYSLAHFKREDT